jgi:RHS repeat-associated protein
VRAITDAAGAIVNQANYRPYGERLETLSLTPESKGFIGQRHDDETGLMYLHARYYDPVLARFIQADPSEPTGAGVGINRYAYALNNPVFYLDPSGLEVGDNYERGYENENGQPIHSYTDRNYGPNEILRAKEYLQGDYTSREIHEAFTMYGNPRTRVGWECKGACTGLNKARENIENTANVLEIIAAAAGIGRASKTNTRTQTAEGAVKTFTSPDPLVADLANKIEARYPGLVKGVNVKIYDDSGRVVAEVDIALQNANIQVKSGSGKGLTTQVLETERLTGLPTIGYGPHLGLHVVRGINQQGGIATRSESDLLDIIAP